MNYSDRSVIDIEALVIALAQQSEPLPSDLQQKLTAIDPDQLDFDRILRDLIKKHTPLENAYMSVLQQRDREYSAQQRNKSITATFSTDPLFDFTFIQTILDSPDWVRSSQQLANPRTTATTKQPEWIRRGNTIVTMISGGAFLGVLLAQIPGAIIGAIAAGLFGWYSSKPKTEQG